MSEPFTLQSFEARPDSLFADWMTPRQLAMRVPATEAQLLEKVEEWKGRGLAKLRQNIWRIDPAVIEEFFSAPEAEFPKLAPLTLFQTNQQLREADAAIEQAARALSDAYNALARVPWARKFRRELFTLGATVGYAHQNFSRIAAEKRLELLQSTSPVIKAKEATL